MSHGLTRALLRLPVWAYRTGLGHLLGRRFLLLTHTGRRTGRRHDTVLEVLRHDAVTDSYVVCAAWGAESQWVRNVEQTPQVMITVGRIRRPAHAERLALPDSARELLRYARRHPTAFRVLARWLTGRPLGSSTDDLLQLARATTVIAFRGSRGPRRSSSLRRV
jgi:deazaflavin-dependent oxidoreductase (nitroreductase family)